MAGWEIAIRPSDEGIVLEVEVMPGSHASRFPSGFNPWRGRIEARVRAPPSEGKANAELCALVADVLGIPARAVVVAAGHTSRRKTVAVQGIGPKAAIERLSGRMAGSERF